MKRIISLALIVCALVTLSAFADPAPRKLPVAQTKDGNIRSALLLFVQPNASAATTFHVGPSGCPSFNVTLAPGQSKDIDDFANEYLCNSAEFQLIDAPPSVARPLVSVTTRDGNNFYVPPIGALEAGRSQSFSISNDAKRQTTITTIDADATIDATVYGPDGAVAGTERFDVKKPFTQYPLKTQVRSGYVVLALYAPICYPCGTPDPVYGLVTISLPKSVNWPVVNVAPFGE
jgi:hypothetical protein